jgi:osmotically-inducible protein OsmY
MSRLPTFLLGVAAGATAAHFLDPDKGGDRRSAVAGKAGSAASSGASTVSSNARYAAGKAKGAANAVTPSPTKLEDADDVTLARKVETEIFRSPEVPKGDVSVDVQNGIVHLRGEVDEEWSNRLAAEARCVDGIKGVENLLHPPGTPAPGQS